MNKKTKGFTLVELIVVIAVLAILAVAAVVALTNVQRNARISTAVSATNMLVAQLNQSNGDVLAANRIITIEALADRFGYEGAPANMVVLVVNGNTYNLLGLAAMNIAHGPAEWGGAQAPVDRSVAFTSIPLDADPSAAAIVAGSTPWLSFSDATQLWEITTENEANIVNAVS